MIGVDHIVLDNYLSIAFLLFALCILLGILIYKTIHNEDDELNTIINEELKDLPNSTLKEYMHNYEENISYGAPMNRYNYLKYLACKKLINTRLKH